MTILAPSSESQPAATEPEAAAGSLAGSPSDPKTKKDPTTIGNKTERDWRWTALHLEERIDTLEHSMRVSDEQVSHADRDGFHMAHKNSAEESFSRLQDAIRDQQEFMREARRLKVPAHWLKECPDSPPEGWITTDCARVKPGSQATERPQRASGVRSLQRESVIRDRRSCRTGSLETIDPPPEEP
jgi:hypothetical protein